MHYDFAIIGGGMGGLIAAGWLRRHRPKDDVCLIEPGQLGKLGGGMGLKYLRWNEELASLLMDLGVSVSPSPICGGILGPYGEGIVGPYPGDLTSAKILALQKSHYLKTRGTLEGMDDRVMNWGGRDQFKMDTSAGLIEALAGGCRIYDSAVTTLHPTPSSTYLKISGSTAMIEAKYVIWTPPLTFLSGLLSEDRINSKVLRYQTLNVMKCEPNTEQAVSLCGHWDYVYTHSCRKIHRLEYIQDESRHGLSVCVEWNGEDGLTDTVLQDLEELGLSPFLGSEQMLPGHLLPLGDIQKQVMKVWRKQGIHLLGRFAAWEGRMTVDQNVAKMEEYFRKE